MISGFIPLSLIDYPNKLACIIFLSGCNFRCGYCHNKDIVDSQTNSKIDLYQLEQFLKKRKGKLEGVVISGGEPTIHEELFELVRLIKGLGYKVKLDTNGSNPQVLEKLLNEELLDYVAMDIKSSFSLYKKVTSSNIEINRIKQTITLLLNSEIEHEFRTTLIDEFHQVQDFEVIGELIKGSNQYILQHYRFSDKQIEPKRYRKVNEAKVVKLKHVLSKYVKYVKVCNG